MKRNPQELSDDTVWPPDASLLRYSKHARWKEGPRVEAAALRRELLGVVMGVKNISSSRVGAAIRLLSYISYQQCKTPVTHLELNLSIDMTFPL